MKPRDEAIRIIRQSKLAGYADAIVAQLIPSVLITAARCSLEDIPIGASRMGGVPDLPEDFDWPRWTGSRLEFAGYGVEKRTTFPERHLEFVAQLNLEEVARYSACQRLPRSGSLCFFYDMENQPWGFDPADHLGSRVVHVPHGATLVRTPSPTAGQWDTAPCSLTFAEEWTIPDWDNYGFHLDDGPALIEELKQEIGATIAPTAPNWAPVHRLFGWPEQIQNDMQRECQLVANGVYCGAAVEDPRTEDLLAGKRDWRLLLQVDTDDENPGWMWGDVGRTYYWIREDDLTNLRFDKARLILQCT